jgi:hypothetical protein
MEQNLKGNKLKEYKKTLVLTELQREIVLGTVIGNASMRKSKTDGAHIKFEQKKSSSEYVDHLYLIFQDWVGTPPQTRNIEENLPTSREPVWFRTYSHSAFLFYYNQFYDESGNKRIPSILKKQLTARVLAYWYMDTGSFSLGNEDYYLHTQGFTKEELINVCIIFKEKFNLKVSPHLDKGNWKLYIWKESGDAFSALIKPYILPIFSYKLKKEEKSS